MWHNAKTVIGNMSDKLKINFLYVELHTDQIGFEKNNDKAALLKHYANYHKKILLDKPCVFDCFRVIFLKQPNKKIWTGVKTVSFQN